MLKCEVEIKRLLVTCIAKIEQSLYRKSISHNLQRQNYLCPGSALHVRIVVQIVILFGKFACLIRLGKQNSEFGTSI
jgi:hypothetical protein